MAAPTLAKTLWPHLDDGWDVVADLSTPGIAAKLAAVRDGNAGTATLPVAAAVKVLGELDDPEAAAVDDQRVAVREALGASRPKTAKKRTSVSARLFAGTPDQVLAALRARRSITPALSTAYRDAAVEVREATWELMLERNRSARVAADILAERAETLGASFAAPLHRYLHRNGLRRVGIHEPRSRNLIVGGRAVLAAWCARNAGPGDTWRVVLTEADDHPFDYDHPPTAAAAAGLGAIAAVLGIEVEGPAQLGAGALAAAADGLHADLRKTARTLGWARTTWADIAEGLQLEDCSASDIVTVIAALAAAGSVDSAAAGVNDFYDGRYEPGLAEAESGTILTACGARLDPAAALRLWCSTWGDRRSSTHWIKDRQRRAVTGLLAYLTTTDDLETDSLRRALSEELCSTIVAEAAEQILTHSGTSTSAAADVVFGHIFDTTPAWELAALAENTSAAAWVGAWARHLDTHICATANATGAERAELWAATLTVVDGFAGTSTDAIDVAAGICAA